QQMPPTAVKEHVGQHGEKRFPIAAQEPVQVEVKDLGRDDAKLAEKQLELPGREGGLHEEDVNIEANQQPIDDGYAARPYAVANGNHDPPQEFVVQLIDIIIAIIGPHDNRGST